MADITNKSKVSLPLVVSIVVATITISGANFAIWKEIYRMNAHLEHFNYVVADPDEGLMVRVRELERNPCCFDVGEEAMTLNE